MVLVEQHEDWITQTYMDPEKLRELYAEENNIGPMPLQEIERSMIGIELLPPLKLRQELVPA